MKRWLLCTLAAFFAVTSFAQGGNTGDGGTDGNFASLAERLLRLEKKTDAFNMYLNFGTSFQETYADGEFTSAFRANHLRLELKGTFGEHLSYRIRHQLNHSAAATSWERFAKATDIMMVGWKFNPMFAVQLGKMCQYFGGFEFDENPMYIYQYSDMVNQMDIFLGGAAFVFTPIPGQEFVFNVSNSYSWKFADEYGEGAVTLQGDILKAASHPLTYVLNWNGSFLRGMLNTRWGAGVYNQAKGYQAYVALFGQKLTLPKFQMYVDYMLSFEGLDRLKIATTDIAGSGYATDVLYQSVVAKMNWQFAPKCNLMAKGMYDTASLPKDAVYKNYRTSIGWVASFEYYPLPDQDLRFFLAYIGHERLFKNGCGLPRNGDHRLEVGLMYRIKCY